ncbi:MAG: MBL fold metallo-hydrolase [Chloroflexi bacterium]|nr:MBL fold metallo-hydrolase [Chloroflexota bacterium]
MVANPRDKFVDLAGLSPEEARFFYTGGPSQVAERTWFMQFGCGCTAFETDEGLVLVDTGPRPQAPVIASEIRKHTLAPLHTTIYTHGHIDHAYALRPFLVDGQARPQVIGHRTMPARFARYQSTSRHNAAVNIRQFDGEVPDKAVFEVAGAAITYQTPDLIPNTLYEDRLTLEVGGLTFELHHARGETDDHTWVFCPQRSVLCSGDLIIWAVPNAGNPQKVQRYPWDWAQALREMAALRPSTLCPGHGGPVIDNPDLVQRILLETADYLDSIVQQSLTAIENGSPPHVDIVRSVRPPTTESPWLQPLYDEAEFICRNVIRYYTGWYTGRPSELKPAPRSAVATEVAQLIGGAAYLADRAAAIAKGGDIRLACHLADYALEAAPRDAHVQDVVARIYEQRAASETSLMAVNLFRSAAAYARAGRPFA